MNPATLEQNDNVIIEKVIDLLEQRESSLLSWGIVEVAEPEIDFATLIDQILDKFSIDSTNFSTAGEVIDRLVKRGLIFAVTVNGEVTYRTRMAETVRLMFHLRQLFPKHVGDNGWQNAPNLIADYRFIWDRRRYPRREISKDAALIEITRPIHSPHLKSAIKELIKFDLARFQVEATNKILRTFSSKARSSVTLITAGTGSGKTLAFYIPALAKIAEAILIDQNSDEYVKSLAIYPRNELLKDQFSEVYREVRKLDSLLAKHGKRKIKIATLFGPTPENQNKLRNDNGTYKWRRSEVNGGHICEFLNCPKPDCTGDMLWLDTDRKKNLEQLICSVCTHKIRQDEIILTRERLTKECPDILFTTIETLNQRLGDNRWNQLFGVGQSESKSIQTFLLDEVHTYTGQTGAQTSYLLKRWRRMIGSQKKISFVGLSATLSNGPQFLEQLTGVPEYRVDVISPAWDEMVEEGAEYALAIRGHPVSKTALLSATIQATMLISRMLDQHNLPLSNGLHGSKVFVFGDDIDVIQRLYHAMNDAEGRFSNGDINGKKNPLAMLRASSNNSQRFFNGQDWRYSEHLGHTLDASDRKQVARVMSMDPGVTENAEIIVASASLEVGFNDPKVGAVIQHKAPRGTAQFLQRKGRAGRKRGMRPWTIVSLSDYARDKFAYQSFEHLFNPELPPSNLPTSSRYIKRMQLVYATMDYLSWFITGIPGSVWTNLWRPSKSTETRQKDRKAKISNKISQILSDSDQRSKFVAYLSQALQLEVAEIEILCWEQPRPLFLEVLPTILRRFEKNWQTANETNREDPITNSPLPEFVPSTFFADLEQADVKITLRNPQSRYNDEWRMNLPQMLREFAPFRVSKRYAMRGQNERYWLFAKPNSKNEYTVELKDSFQFIQKGHWSISDGGKVQSTLVCQPTELLLDVPDRDIVDTSNAFPVWQTQLVAKNHGEEVAVSQKITWSKFLPKIIFHTHALGSQIEARRMSIGSDATIKRKDGTSTNTRVRFKHNGEPAALGFSQEVDAVKFNIVVPKSTGQYSRQFEQAVRTNRFFYEIEHNKSLSGISNQFVRRWLATLTHSSICIEALNSKVSVNEAIKNLRNGTASTNLHDTLTVLFQSKIVMTDLAQANDNDSLAASQDTLRSELEHWINRSEIIDAIWDLSSTLCQKVDPTWQTWLDQQFVNTLAAAITDAVQSLCPDFDVANLIVDIGPGVQDEHDVYQNEDQIVIWLSESAPGGVGQIEDFVIKYSDDPRRFFDLLSFSMTYNDLYAADKSLSRFINLMTTDPDEKLKSIVATTRSTVGNEQRTDLHRLMNKRLNEIGLKPFHAFNVALYNRVLKVGSTPASDVFFQKAIEYWDKSEQRLGLELDARLVAYCLVSTGHVDDFFKSFSVDPQTFIDLNWRFSTCYSLLWTRGGQVRRYGLSLYSRYSNFPEVDPIYVTEFTSEVLSTVDVASENWIDTALNRLADTGSVILSAKENELKALNSAINIMATNPVNTGYISAYSRLGQLRKKEDRYLVTLDLAEVML